MAKKSLADQIADLTKPENPDFDIEDAENEAFEDEEHVGDSDESDEGNDAGHYVTVGKSNLRDNSIRMKDQKYTGVSSSRKDIFGDHHEPGDDDEVSDDQDLSSEDEVENEDHQSSENASDSSDSGLSLEGNSEDEDDNESQTDEEQVTTKREKLKEMMAAERKHIINRLSSSTQVEALKGYAVLSQQMLFDNILDTRIKLQKAVTMSNYLPLTNESFDEFKSGSSDISLEQLEENLHALLDNIISLRVGTYQKDNITKDNLHYKKGVKRNLAEYVEETEKLDLLSSKFRESVLNKWLHKVQAASGVTALNASKFKTINQSAAQQVELNLMDMDRLVKRTRLNRRNIKYLGQIEEENEAFQGEKEQSKVDKALAEDASIFDDEDFYRVLLNDLIDKKVSEANPVNGLAIHLTKTKVKKNVDTKASKGRKLRYHVQEPIQNYDAPRGKFKWNDDQIDEFFAGLLGQRVDFDEDESSPEDIEEAELKNDDIMIFG